MLKEIMRIFMEKTTLIDQMGSEFAKMLETGKNMFIAVTGLLYCGGDAKQVYDKVYPPDKELNKLECKIRSEVVTHISIAGTSNLSAMLIFMSVVKDGERIGDYVKNTYEVAVKAKEFQKGKYADELLNIKNEIVSKFDSVPAIFKENNQKGAATCINEITKLQKQCDKIIENLIENYSVENSVSYALVARYFKRILAHLSNIATAVIMPVDKLDYFDEDNITKYQE
jgi:phosphate uptake regulator